MGDKSDDSGEVLRGAARAYSTPAHADLDMLVRLDRALHTVPVSTAGMLPWQRPPQHGEDSLATRHHR